MSDKAREDFENWYKSDSRAIGCPNLNTKLAAKEAWLAAKEKYEPRLAGFERGEDPPEERQDSALDEMFGHPRNVLRNLPRGAVMNAHSDQGEKS